MESYLLSLPVELLIRILSKLDAVSLHYSTLTCKFIYDVIETSSQLQYTKELHLDGLKDAGTSAGYPTLIEELRRRRHSWYSSGLSLPLRIDTRGMDFIRPWELVGGLFASATSEWKIQISRLPTSTSSSYCGIEKQLDDIHLTEITMDPSQDMLVLMDDGVQSIESPDPGIRVVKIYIHTLSSGDPHPLALHSPFQLIIYRAEGSCSYIVHDLDVFISGRTLALFLKTCAEGTEIRQILRSRVVIWDWISGQMMMDSSLCFDAEFEFSSREYAFGLLDSRVFFVASPAACGSIRIYKLAEIGMSTMDGISAPIHLATFHLPPLIPGSTIRRVEAYSGPIENRNASNSLPKVPFLVNDDDRLHLLSLLFDDIDRPGINPPHIEFLQIFLHQRIFMENSSCVDSSTPLDVQWEEWGPQNTRIVYPGFFSPYFPRYIHGQRAIFRGPIDHVGGTYSHRYTKSAGILDFSCAAVSFARASPSHIPPDIDSNALLSTFISSPEMLQFSCKEPTLLPPSTVRTSDLSLLVNDLETRLPCVLMTKDFGDKFYAGYMIYGDGILGLDINEEMHLSLDLYHV